LPSDGIVPPQSDLLIRHFWYKYWMSELDGKTMGGVTGHDQHVVVTFPVGG
jgi:hypothetical protein